MIKQLLTTFFCKVIPFIYLPKMIDFLLCWNALTRCKDIISISLWFKWRQISYATWTLNMQEKYTAQSVKLLPNLEGIHNSRLVDISYCSSLQQFPMQQLQNCKHLLCRLNNPIMHILVPYILYKSKSQCLLIQLQ